MNKWTKLAAAAALVGALTMAVPGTSLSANLTGGNYTYVIQGEEVTFSFDPIVRQTGLLLPVEVFQQFGVKIDNALSKNITLSKDNVSVTTTLGVTNITANGKPDNVATAPVRLSGRLFLPADLLRQFGVDYSQDGNYITLRSYVDTVPEAKQLTDSDYSSLKIGRSFTTNVKLDSNQYVMSDFTLLNADLINTANLGLTYGARARLLGLLPSNTLVLVHLSNTGSKSGAMTTSGLYLVDANRNQYDTPTVLDIGSGLLSNKLAPGADRTGVLVFPKVATNAGSLTFFYDANGSSVGTIVNP